MNNFVCVILILINSIFLNEAILSYDPQISYFDGHFNSLDHCQSKLERKVSGLSGLLISHQLYGTHPYNGSKNCFLLITAPIGYRIRLRVLDFNVLGDPKNCNKDTLHVFDHEKAIEPQKLNEVEQEEISPGPILGQFCGLIRNASELAVSTENALTLWWHSDANLPINHNGEGFRLLWSAFRKSNSAPCNIQREFTCDNNECIPAELACNRYPDCKDESDLSRERQIAHKCDYFDADPLSSLTGLNILLICMAFVSMLVCICICICICCKCMRKPDKARVNLNNGRAAVPSSCVETDSQPNPPAFYPPSPPHQRMLFTESRLDCLTRNSLKSQNNHQITNSLIKQIPYSTAQYGNLPTSTRQTNHFNDYSYVRNDSKHLLI